MTQEEVRGLLGKPNRVEQEGLAEDWFYQAVERRRMVTSESNGSLPGETVHERDLRHSLEGVRNSASISTETVTRERTLHFGEDGRLVAKEPFRLLPGE